MRIAFYSPRALHLDLPPYAGGDSAFPHSLFDALRARGHEIEVVSRLDIRDVWRGRVPLRRLLREAIESRRRVKRFAPDAWLVFRASRTERIGVDVHRRVPRPRRHPGPRRTGERATSQEPTTAELTKAGRDG